MSEEILYHVADGIARLTFNRPAQRNALTFAMYDRLEAVCRTLAGPEGSEIRALLISGAGGKAFAAGTDIGQFRAFSTPEDAIAYEARLDRVTAALEACPVPTIAAVTGACTGGGAAIAACCDLRIADPTAKFGVPIARTLGNCLSLANLARLSGLLGAGRVKELIFTARLIEAEEGRAIGLWTELVAAPDALMPRAEALARLLAGHAPLTLRATKEGLRRLGTLPEGGEDLVTLCYMSADFREGMEAFLAKRPPQWQGK